MIPHELPQLVIFRVTIKNFKIEKSALVEHWFNLDHRIKLNESGTVEKLGRS
jgi:hypothetical protein